MDGSLVRLQKKKEKKKGNWEHFYSVAGFSHGLFPLHLSDHGASKAGTGESTQVTVLIWNFFRDIYGHERHEHYDNTINNSLLS